ncbi:MAG: DUF4093 domain-containing protein [Clostridia bacterium]|nr:DUF4093 domain-containing protein [Clostridia bacterium]
MIHLEQAIVVEGKYDKNTLSQLVDAPIFTTNGFSIMNNREQLSFLRTVAEKRGLIILTDSDSAGFMIRSKLKGCLPANTVFHAYIPDIYGKEKRKAAPGKEGKLGVEGMKPEVLQKALLDAGVALSEKASVHEAITKNDFYSLGLSGTDGSEKRRQALKKKLLLPERMSTNSLLDAINILYTRDEFYHFVQEEKL